MHAQPLKVYSEFMRVGPGQSAAAADRGTSPPREILSPAVARNAFASFRIVVDAAAGVKWALYVGQNPDNAVDATLYREAHREGLPVRLQKEDVEPAHGEGFASFWLDLWVAGDAPVRRIKVEPQLNIGEQWITYPMEVRVVDAVVPIARMPPMGPAPSPAAAADAAATAALASKVCGPRKFQPSAPDAPGNLVLRNALQDLSLWDGVASILALAGIADRAAWCRAPGRPDTPHGSEWFLRLRSRLYSH